MGLFDGDRNQSATYHENITKYIVSVKLRIRTLLPLPFNCYSFLDPWCICFAFGATSRR